MGNDSAPLVVDLFLFCYERHFMMSFSDDQHADINDAFKSKEVGNDQESIQSSTTSYPRHHIGKRQNHQESSHIGEPRVSPFPAGDHKAARNR